LQKAFRDLPPGDQDLRVYGAHVFRDLPLHRYPASRTVYRACRPDDQDFQVYGLHVLPLYARACSYPYVNALS